MKYILGFCFACLCIPAISQVDTIFTTNKGVLGCNVKDIGLINIKYQFPDEVLVYDISPMQVTKIKFRSGRVQNFVNTEKYPESIKKEFIGSCLEGKSVKEAYCICTFEKIEAKFSYEDFTMLSTLLNKGEMTKELTDFFTKLAFDCKEYLKN